METAAARQDNCALWWWGYFFGTHTIHRPIPPPVALALSCFPFISLGRSRTPDPSGERNRKVQADLRKRRGVILKIFEHEGEGGASIEAGRFRRHQHILIIVFPAPPHPFTI